MSGKIDDSKQHKINGSICNDDKNRTNKHFNKKKRIYKLISESGCTPIPRSELAKKSNYKEKTINWLISELNDELSESGGDTIYNLGRQKGYILSSHIANRDDSQSNIFGLDSMREILGKNLSSSLFPGEFDPPQHIKIETKREKTFFDKIIKNSDLSNTSKFLLDFVLKVGSLIVFNMIEAIEPSIKNKKRLEKDERILTWVENTIKPIMILNHFVQNDIVEQGKMIRESHVKQSLKEMSSKIPNSHRQALLDKSIPDEYYSFYEIDKKTFQLLEEGFKQIWPYTYMVLKNLRDPDRTSKIIEDSIASTYIAKKANRNKRKEKN